MTEAKRGPGRPKKVAVESITKQKRTPLGVPRQKLSLDKKDPNYSYRWLNDSGDRINQALEGGYEFVRRGDTSAPGDMDVVPQNTDLGTNVSKVVGTTESGAPLTAYLMKLKKSFYEADQAEKQAQINETERGLKAGQSLKDSLGDHGYVKTASFKTQS